MSYSVQLSIKNVYHKPLIYLIFFAIPAILADNRIATIISLIFIALQ